MITLENLTLSNPGEVLAVCGLFVLATRQDRKATLAWTDNGAVIDTDQTLDELLQSVIDAEITLINDVHAEKPTKSDPIAVQIGNLKINWWYIPYRDKKPRSKQIKFWSGKVIASSLIKKLHIACKRDCK